MSPTSLITSQHFYVDRGALKKRRVRIDQFRPRLTQISLFKDSSIDCKSYQGSKGIIINLCTSPMMIQKFPLNETTDENSFKTQSC